MTTAATLHPRSPGRAHLWTFAAVSLAYAALTLSIIPWAREAGVGNPRIVLAYGGAILIADFCTAMLLGAQYRVTGRGALLLLACTYLYSALMAGLHIAVFPGAVYAQPMFGSEQAVSWLYLAWRLGTSALLFVSVLRAGEAMPALPRAELDRRLARAIALTLAAVLAVALAATHIKIAGVLQDQFTSIGVAVQWSGALICAAGLVLIWVRRAFNDVLYLWLGLVLVGWIADLTLSNVGGGRYALAWHASRASFVVSSCLLLAFLLADLAKERVRSGVTAIAAYGGAVAVVVAAVHLRWLLEPWLGTTVPYITLYGAIAIAVWFGGWGPAALATVVGFLLVDVLFIDPRGTIALHGAAELLGLVLYAVSCALIIVLGEGMRRARNLYRASEVALRERAMQLQRADANKSQFLAILSHELRNPLAPLRTGLAILKRQREAGAPADVHDMMDRQITQLTRLIDDLLDVSRIDRGKLELRSERVALDAVARNAIETASPNIAAKSHELVVRYAPQPLHVQGDPVRLAQAISNLLNNAAKFTPDHGRIELSMRAEDAQAVISVADNGIGLAPEHLTEVFEMFVQLDSSRAAGSGLGLGLTLARSIVAQHGGKLEAHSAGAGKGTEFVIRLPLVAAPPAVEDKASAVPRLRSGRRILVVDDNPDAAYTLAELLRIEGHQVETALDGATALRIAEAQRPEVAFIDLNMPGMDGIELARRLRAAPWGQAARLVAVTGMGQQSDIARTHEAGFDEHLTKPADPTRVMRLAAGEPAPLRSTTRARAIPAQRSEGNSTPTPNR
jgi:signal transduction histidine kinase/ActR/RegA family two-component response regulator